ncbi:MAG: metal/formaldehyde-sensitive transcriptional repressor [Gemmatimonadales bacterium]
MAHTVRDKQKLLRRVQRIIGQVEAVKRALESEEDCADIMQLIAAARGAMNSLMAEVVEGHVRYHMVDPDRRPTSAEARAAQELIDVVRSYVK